MFIMRNYRVFTQLGLLRVFVRRSSIKETVSCMTNYLLTGNRNTLFLELKSIAVFVGELGYSKLNVLCQGNMNV